MNTSDLLALRLYNTGLSNFPFESTAEVVSRHGAVQAQDFTAAKWALGRRITNSTDEEIERAFNEGTILRTHVMRPTWHFIMPEDIRWMLSLTAPRVKAALAHYNKKLGLDDTLLSKSNDTIVSALKDHPYLTRQELRAILADSGIETDIQRLGHIIAWAELDALICSGPRRGKQFTYTLLEKRVRRTQVPNRDQALARLARRYFASHGPAQLKDFSWWSGLGDKDAKYALTLIESEMTPTTLNDRTFWYFPPAGITIPNPPPALLLSLYDEFTIAYRDRSDFSETRDVERMISRGAAVTAVIIVNGRVAGSWNKVRKKNSVEIRLNPFRKLDSDEKEALESEVTRYRKFTGIPAFLADTE